MDIRSESVIDIETHLHSINASNLHCKALNLIKLLPLFLLDELKFSISCGVLKVISKN